MNNQMIKIGFGNLVNGDRIIAIVKPDAAPIRRIIQEAKDRGEVIDATSGKKTKSVLIMDSEHIIISAMETDEIETQFLEEKGDF